MTLYTVHPDTRDPDGSRVAGVWIKKVDEQQAQADIGPEAEVEAAEAEAELGANSLELS